MGQSTKSNSFQLVLLMEDSSVVMVHSPGEPLHRDDVISAMIGMQLTPGEVAWVREDGLGSVVSMEAVDLPPADQSGSIANFIEATINEGNPLKLALMRLQLQFSLAKVTKFCMAKKML